MNDNEAGCTALVLVVAAFIAGAVICKCLVDDSWRYQIEKHHAAEFYLDANHNRQWRWLDEKPSAEIKP